MLDSERVQVALDYMREHGHCKFALEDDDGRVCLVGSFTASKMFNSLDWPYISSIFSKVIAEQYPENRNDWNKVDPVKFNNHPQTTQLQVEQVMEKVIVQLQERGR